MKEGRIPLLVVLLPSRLIGAGAFRRLPFGMVVLSPLSAAFWW